MNEQTELTDAEKQAILGAVESGDEELNKLLAEWEEVDDGTLPVNPVTSRVPTAPVIINGTATHVVSAPPEVNGVQAGSAAGPAARSEGTPAAQAVARAEQPGLRERFGNGVQAIKDRIRTAWSKSTSGIGIFVDKMRQNVANLRTPSQPAQSISSEVVQPVAEQQVAASTAMASTATTSEALPPYLQGKPETTQTREAAPPLTGIQEYRSHALQTILANDALGKSLGLGNMENQENVWAWRELQGTVFDVTDLAAAQNGLQDTLARVTRTTLGLAEGADLPDAIVNNIVLIVKNYSTFHLSTPVREMTKAQRAEKISTLDAALEKAKTELEATQSLVDAHAAPGITVSDEARQQAQEALEKAKQAVVDAEKQLDTQDGLVAVKEINKPGKYTFTLKQDFLGRDQAVIHLTPDTVAGGKAISKRLITLHLNPLLTAIKDADQVGDNWEILYNHNRLQPTEDVGFNDVEEVTKFVLTQEQFDAFKSFADTQTTAQSEAQWFFDRLAKTHITKETGAWLKKAKDAKAASQELSPVDQVKVKAAVDLQVLFSTISTLEEAGSGITDEHAAELKRLMAILEVGNNQQQTTELRSRLAIEKLFAGKASEAVQQSTLSEGKKGWLDRFIDWKNGGDLYAKGKEKAVELADNGKVQFLAGMALSELAGRLLDWSPTARSVVGTVVTGSAFAVQYYRAQTISGLASMRDRAQANLQKSKYIGGYHAAVASSAEKLLSGVKWLTDVADRHFSPRSTVFRNVFAGFGAMGALDGAFQKFGGEGAVDTLVGWGEQTVDTTSDALRGVAHSMSDVWQNVVDSDEPVLPGNDPAISVSGGSPAAAGEPTIANGGDVAPGSGKAMPDSSAGSGVGANPGANPDAPNNGASDPLIPQQEQPIDKGGSVTVDPSNTSNAMPKQGSAPEGWGDESADNAPEPVVNAHEAIRGQGLHAIAQEALDAPQMPEKFKTEPVANAVVQAVEKINVGIVPEHTIVYRDGPQAGEPIPTNYVHTGDSVTVSHDPAEPDLITVTVYRDALEVARGNGTEISGSMQIQLESDGTATILEDTLSISAPATETPAVEAPVSAEAAPPVTEASQAPTEQQNSPAQQLAPAQEVPAPSEPQPAVEIAKPVPFEKANISSDAQAFVDGQSVSSGTVGDRGVTIQNGAVDFLKDVTLTAGGGAAYNEGDLVLEMPSSVSSVAELQEALATAGASSEAVAGVAFSDEQKGRLLQFYLDTVQTQATDPTKLTDLQTFVLDNMTGIDGSAMSASELSQHSDMLDKILKIANDIPVEESAVSAAGVDQTAQSSSETSNTADELDSAPETLSDDQRRAEIVQKIVEQDWFDKVQHPEEVGKALRAYLDQVDAEYLGNFENLDYAPRLAQVANEVWSDWERYCNENSGLNPSSSSAPDSLTPFRRAMIEMMQKGSMDISSFGVQQGGSDGSGIQVNGDLLEKMLIRVANNPFPLNSNGVVDLNGVIAGLDTTFVYGGDFNRYSQAVQN